MIVHTSIKMDFSAAHFYNQKDWSIEKNKDEFGLCYSTYGHGHNYQWVVHFICENSQVESQHIQVHKKLSQILEKIDHKHLNQEVPYFKNKIPTTENISLFLKERLKEAQFRWTSFQLFETETIWVEMKNV